MKLYKHLLASGCSFSSNGIGGTPPTSESNGGCSFIDDPDFPAVIPTAWTSMLAQRLNVSSFVNTASVSHGNMLVANTIQECLNRYNYPADSTLVVMNLSEPSRFDIPCHINSLYIDKENIPWDKSLIPYSYINRRSSLSQKVNINIMDTVEQITTNAIELLFTFLTYKKLDFRFLVMADFTNTPLERIINEYYKNFVSLTPGTNMIDFCKITNTTIGHADHHPNQQGHQLIADAVYRTL